MLKSTRINKYFTPDAYNLSVLNEIGIKPSEVVGKFIALNIAEGKRRLDWQQEFQEYIQSLTDKKIQQNKHEPATVDSLLNELAEIYLEKSEQYGESYQRVGEILNTLFPDALELKTPADHMRYSLFNMMIHKVNRYANNIMTGGHFDSLDDLAVYAMMLRKHDINSK